MEITPIAVKGYEEVVRVEDPAAGLSAYIAIHDTTLGPALGGLRMWPFKGLDEALTDALRLAEGMTYKSAVAHTGLGGGKAVLVGDPARDKTEALFEAVGRAIDTLDGRYITAEDVGTTTSDMLVIRRTTRHVTGLPREAGGSGNPSPFTSLGVFRGIQATWEDVTGSQDLSGVPVAVQGLGQVGAGVARHLAEAGASLVVTDAVPGKVAAFLAEVPAAEAVAPEAIFDARCDIFSPNALGGIVNSATIERMRCRAIAGGANNQILEPRHGALLRARGILYAPDFVINAGGIINVAAELDPRGYDPERSMALVERIPDALREVFEISRIEGVPTNEAAALLARTILRKAPRHKP